MRVKSAAAFLLSAFVAVAGSVAAVNAGFWSLAQLGSNSFTTATLQPPTGLSVSGGLCPTQSWTATTSGFASGYQLFRSTSAGGPYSEVATIQPRTTTTYSDRPGSGSYYYVLRSYFQNWTSPYTSEAAVTLSRTLYLHNNPSPPTANTSSQANLPLNETQPTAGTLYNYDSNRDSYAGLTVERSGSGLSESDSRKFQAWRTAALGCDLVLNGNASFVVWAGTWEFRTGRAGSITAYLRAFNGSTYTEIGNGTVTSSNWQSGSSTFVQQTLTVSGLNYTVPAGHQLEVRLMVNQSNSAENMMIAYDTTSYPTRLTLP